MPSCLSELEKARMKNTAKDGHQSAVAVAISAGAARIESSVLAIEFDLSNGTYTGTDKSGGTQVFKNAWYRLGQKEWREPSHTYSAEQLGEISDRLGTGAALRVWYKPEAKYDPWRFLDITVYRVVGVLCGQSIPCL